MHKEKQQGLFKVLTYGRKNRLPLFTLILDSFMRDRISHFHKHGTDLTSQEWKNDYQTLANLVKNSTTGKSSTEDILKGGIDSFATRYTTFLNLGNIEGKIDDSIDVFTDFIVECTRFINTIITKDGVSPPCQVYIYIYILYMLSCPYYINRRCFIFKLPLIYTMKI